MQGSEVKVGEIPQALMWVKDAPLFIDGANLAQLYDAAVRPAYKEDAPVKIKISETQKKDLEKKFGGKTGLHVPAWLSVILSGGAEVSGEVKTVNSSGKTSDSEITLCPITTPHLSLIHI